MTLPTFLGPFVPLPQPLATTRSSPIGGAAAAANALPFSRQQQQENNWCWAATSSSVSYYFDLNSQWSQCNIASACLQIQCCATSAPCDVQFTLDGPLSQTGNLQGIPFSGNDTQNGLQSEIDAGRPVCCHITWVGGTGHFVAISGYDWNTGDVLVEDPLYGQYTVPYQTFVSSYRGSGSWDYTYYTQP